MFVLTLIILISLSMLFVIERKRINFNKKFRHIPGPRSIPVIGNIDIFKLRPTTTFETAISYISTAPISKSTFFGFRAFSIFDPDTANKILLSSKFLERPYLFHFFGTDLSVGAAKYDFWKPLRKRMNPSFNQKAVQMMTPIFNKHIDALMESLEQHVTKKHEIDLLPILQKSFIQQIFETLFDTKFIASDVDMDNMCRASEIVSERMMTPWYYEDTIFNLFPLGREMKKIDKYCRHLLRAIFEEKSMDLSKKSQRRIMIDDLIRANLPDNVVIDNLWFMLPAGFETSIITVSHVILLLAMHPDVDRLLYEEIKERYVTELDHETVKSMKYLDMVVMETLRLFPAVPGTIRETYDDTFIENIGTIPKGTIILIISYLMHRDPQIWGPDANKFDPTNFTSDKIAERPPHCYIPFSAGPRNCIGMNYALLNIKLSLVKILSQYRFTTSLKYEDIQTRFSIVLKMSSQYLVQVHRR